MNLEAYRARILTRLADAAGLTWSEASVDEALRAALGRYTQACPRVEQYVLNLGATGALDLSAHAARLTGVLAVNYPWNDARPRARTQVRGWRIYRSGAALELALTLCSGAPTPGALVCVFFSARREVQGLDGAESSTVEPEHETLLVTGAAAEALVARAARRAESGQLDVGQSRLLCAVGRENQAAFLDGLDEIRLTGWDAYLPTRAAELAGWQG